MHAAADSCCPSLRQPCARAGARLRALLRYCGPKPRKRVCSGTGRSVGLHFLGLHFLTARSSTEHLALLHVSPCLSKWPRPHRNVPLQVHERVHGSFWVVAVPPNLAGTDSDASRSRKSKEGPEITVTRATRLKSKHTILPPYTKIVTSSNLTSGPFSYHPQHRSQRRRHEKGRRSASG